MGRLVQATNNLGQAAVSLFGSHLGKKRIVTDTVPQLVIP